jgi:hypothetical protein
LGYLGVFHLWICAHREQIYTTSVVDRQRFDADPDPIPILILNQDPAPDPDPASLILIRIRIFP